MADRVQRGPAVPAIGRESVIAQASAALKAVGLRHDLYLPSLRHTFGGTVIRCPLRYERSTEQDSA